MKTGYMMLFQNAHPGLSDADMVRREMRIAESTEELGFDIIWSAEHHFDYYSILPDNLQTLAYLAGRTRKIQLGSAAVILPWNDPLRVAEKILMLDALCDGRFVFGIGRGLARMEYTAFGIPMEEARPRFNEFAPMVLNAIETGVIEGNGPYYKQRRTELRPRPTRTFKDRFYGVAMSNDSFPLVGELGATMMFFLQFAIENHVPGVNIWRDNFKKAHARSAPPPVAIDICVCDKDAGRAEELARKYVAEYYLSVLKHYEFLEDYHKHTKGYEAYGAAAEILKAAGKEKALQDFVDVQAWGTPQQILDKLEKRRGVLGDFEWNVMASFAGMPFETVDSSLSLLGKEVLPEVRRWAAAARDRAA
jgi:alkanesulfonate monooxygenase SsuD/methylene tetrahydromethanopterin reductase-like flavin-dependent oxidoreductase (luciferase family)